MVFYGIKNSWYVCREKIDLNDEYRREVGRVGNEGSERGVG